MDFTPNRASYAIDVPAHGCGVANIGMISNGSIAGTVVEHDGTPVKNINVEYLHFDKNVTDPWFRDRSTKTNERGQFHSLRVPPGEFLLGVHVDTPPKAEERILPTYWPGATDIAKAQLLRLAVNEQRAGLVIKLGSRAKVRRVNVKVRWPDDRPGVDANVSADVNGGIAELAKTDENGAVEFSLLDGVEYSFRARAWTSFRMVNGNKIGADWVDTEEKSLTATSSTNDVILVLNKPKPLR